jgi:hypothetical protein
MRTTSLALTALAGSMLFLVPGAQAFDWNGPYVGGVVGIVKSTGDIDWDTGNYGGTFEFEGIGVLAGVTSGINFRLDGNMVVGIEGDASIAWLHNTGSEANEFAYDAEFEEELQSLLTLRGRFGALSDDENTLFFVTGGLAGGQVSASALIEEYLPIDDAEAAEMSGFAVGVIGGIGVEHVVKDDLTVKAEVLAYALGSLDGEGYSGKGDSTATYNPSGILLRTGLNFHF